MKKFFVVTFILMLTLTAGCTFMHKDFANYGKNYESIDLHLLTLGDSKPEVIEKIGEPENVIGSRVLDNGVIEVWSYEKWHAALGNDRKEAEYWLYFLNDELAQWGRPGDWAAEADRIYEIRVR